MSSKSILFVDDSESVGLLTCSEPRIVASSLTYTHCIAIVQGGAKRVTSDVTFHEILLA